MILCQLSKLHQSSSLSTIRSLHDSYQHQKPLVSKIAVISVSVIATSGSMLDREPPSISLASDFLHTSLHSQFFILVSIKI